MFGKMCGIKIVLAFGVLLAAAYARPDGYGVKGVKSFRATANAAATAYAFGNTGPGGSGIARSFATASADANAGSTANAAAEATANAFTDGENIGKAISSASAIANVNHPIGESNVLDRPSDEGTEYKASNHRDGTPACGQHIANAVHGGLVTNENSTPGNIDLTNSATVCHPGDSNCRDPKNDHSVSRPHPTYNEYPDSSSGSSQPLPDRDGGWGGKIANPGSRHHHIPNPDQTYSGHVELPDDSEKAAHDSTVFNPQLMKKGYPDFAPAPVHPLPNIKSGWGSNTAHSGPRSCPKCAENKPDVSNPDQSHYKHSALPAGTEMPVNEPSISNPHPSYNEHPDLSTGSSQPFPKPDGGWEGNIANPGSHSCTASGSQKCSGGQPDVSNPNQPHDKHVELIADSEKAVSRPSVLNPHPLYNEHPDLSTGLSQPWPKPNGGWGGNTANPGSPPCTSGSRKCSGGQPDVPNPNQPHDKHVELTADSGKPVPKPSVSNSHPSYNEHPDLATSSSQPWPKPNGGWEGNIANPGSRPCTSESPKCSGGQPDVPNPIQPHDKHAELIADSEKPDSEPSVSNPHPDLSTGSSQQSSKPEGGWAGNTANPGPPPCTSGSRKCSGRQPDVPNPIQPHDKHIEVTADSGKQVPRPNVSNPQPSYNEHPDLPAGSSQPLPNLDDGYGGHKSIKPMEEKDDVKGGNRHLPFNKNVDESTSSAYPSPNLSGGCVGNSATPGSRPCTSGSFGSKPETSNPFLNGEIDVSETQKAVKSSVSSPESSGKNPLNPFLNPHSQYPSMSTSGTRYLENPNSNDKAGPFTQYPKSKPYPSNPFLNGHSQHPTTLTGNTYHSENPNNSVQGRPSDEYPESKPNSSNQHRSPSTAGTDYLENQNGSDKAGPSSQHPHSEQTPSNAHSQQNSSRSSDSCRHKGTNAENDNKNSNADGIGNGKTPDRTSNGVKTYRPGVKKGSAHRPQSSSPIKYHVSGHGDEASADANAAWDGYSKAHAIASASAGGDGSSDSKSQAHSSANASGWSNSWASSSASASASAYSSS